MSDEQTNAPDANGSKDDQNLPNDTSTDSLYDKTEAIVKRQEEANKKGEEILKKLANEKLAGTTGGNVPTKVISPEDKKKAQAKEFFKGTLLEEAIDKA